MLEETETPNPNQPFGAKGAGEAGCIGVPPAVLNAVADALGLVDGDELQLPATPDKAALTPGAAQCPAADTAWLSMPRLLFPRGFATRGVEGDRKSVV